MRRTLTISAHFFNSWNACRMKIPMVKKQTKGLGDTTEVLPLINSAGPITKRPRSEKKKTWALPYTTCAVTESTRTVRNTEGTRQTLKSKQQGTRSPGGIKICVKRELLLPCKPAEQDICIKPKVSLCAKCWFSLQKPRIYTHFHSTSCIATSLKKKNCTSKKNAKFFSNCTNFFSHKRNANKLLLRNRRQGSPHTRPLNGCTNQSNFDAGLH